MVQYNRVKTNGIKRNVKVVPSDENVDTTHDPSNSSGKDKKLTDLEMLAIRSWNEGIIPASSTKWNDLPEELVTYEEVNETNKKFIQPPPIIYSVSPMAAKSVIQKTVGKNDFKMRISKKLALAFIDQSDELMLDLIKYQAEYLLSVENADDAFLTLIKYKTIAQLNEASIGDVV